jgi:hypothetical protein
VSTICAIFGAGRFLAHAADGQRSSRRRYFETPRISEHQAGYWDRPLFELHCMCSLLYIRTIRSMAALGTNSAFMKDAAINIVDFWWVSLFML